MIYKRYQMILLLLIIQFPAFAQSTSNSDDDIAQIFISHGGKLTFERVRELAVLKAADMTLARGYTHFEFMYSPGRPVLGSVERQGNMLKDVYGNASESTFESYLVPTPIKEKSSVFVKFCNENDSKCRGINAKSVLKNLHR